MECAPISSSEDGSRCEQHAAHDGGMGEKYEEHSDKKDDNDLLLQRLCDVLSRSIEQQ